MRIKSGIALCLLYLASLPLPASASGLRGIIRLGGDFGGDKLLPTLLYTDGTESTVNAGRGLLLSAGGAMSIYEADDHQVELRALLGVKYATIVEATNANAEWVRWPLEALVFYGYKGLRLGGGVTYHFGNSFEGSGFLNGYQMKYDSALGAVGQIEYWFSPKFGIDFRYSNLTYKLISSSRSDAKSSLSAESMGFGMSFTFGGASAGAPAPAPQRAAEPAR